MHWLVINPWVATYPPAPSDKTRKAQPPLAACTFLGLSVASISCVVVQTFFPPPFSLVELNYCLLLPMYDGLWIIGKDK